MTEISGTFTGIQFWRRPLTVRPERNRRLPLQVRAYLKYRTIKPITRFDNF